MTLDIDFTPTQQRLFDLLKDGEQHTKSELLAAIDELASGRNLVWHLMQLRGKLYPAGYLIAGHSAGKAGASSYQLVQRLRVRLD